MGAGEDSSWAPVAELAGCTEGRRQPEGRGSSTAGELDSTAEAGSRVQAEDHMDRTDNHKGTGWLERGGR